MQTKSRSNMLNEGTLTSVQVLTSIPMSILNQKWFVQHFTREKTWAENSTCPLVLTSGFGRRTSGNVEICYVFCCVYNTKWCRIYRSWQFPRYTLDYRDTRIICNLIYTVYILWLEHSRHWFPMGLCVFRFQILWTP